MSRAASTSISFAHFASLLRRHQRLALSVLGGSLLLCLLYCLIAPPQYEAHARVGLRQDPVSALSMNGAVSAAAASSLLYAPLQQETLAQELRSEHLAWELITQLRLYDAAEFRSNFASRFPGFHADAPDPLAREWLLKRFERSLTVRSIPHSLILEVRFRCRDAALSANVVNTLLRLYAQAHNEQFKNAAGNDILWLNSQLDTMQKQMEADRQKLVAFEHAHGIANDGQDPDRSVNAAENARQAELDELGRQLATASSERIVAEAAYRAALHGDPEAVARNGNSDRDDQNDFSTAVLQQILRRHSELEEESALLSAEHGPNYPRVLEIHRQTEDLDRQRKQEDLRLTERFRSAWERDKAREENARRRLEEAIAAEIASNFPASLHMQLQSRLHADQTLWQKLKDRSTEAGVLAGMDHSNLTLLDAAQTPGRAVSPNLPLLMSVTLLLGSWAALAAILIAEAVRPAAAISVLIILFFCASGGDIAAQAPTPSTSGLPSGVAHPVLREERKPTPAVREAQPASDQPAPIAASPAPTALPTPTTIGPGDLIDLQEYRTPELHALLRVAADGTIAPPMIQALHIEGMSEQQAAHAVEAALVAQGVLLHPHVTVLINASAGQDVSVLGEVARPGVYPWTVHHRLLDLISAASGLSPTAGRLVNICHRGDPQKAHAVVLDPNGTDPTGEHNPELEPGDTVQVSRAGLVYVIGDVVRPGGFSVDPSQGLTVVQALSLAWGPAQNAATTRAILIREQKGGRTLTRLNLGRMLRGVDPDQPIRDRDILFVPDSTAKNLLNRSIESAIQSTVGVAIYAGLVYSQRF